ncbi:MAG: YlxR family protein [Acidimicrobiales bacterium]|nr:YlxR family protein [Acidimicrobiales bacterium]
MKPAETMQRVTRNKVSGDLVFGGPSLGRGVWVCSEACRERALESGAFDRSLKTRGRSS